MRSLVFAVPSEYNNMGSFVAKHLCKQPSRGAGEGDVQPDYSPARESLDPDYGLASG